MGMSTHVQGFKAPDDRWRAMKAVWDACLAAGVKPPEVVSSYFEGESPHARGVEVQLERTKSCSAWQDDYRSGFEIDLQKLPYNLTHIRFYNSF